MTEERGVSSRKCSCDGMRPGSADPHRIIDLTWEWLDRPGLEHARVELGGELIIASGVVVTVLDDQPLRLNYALDCDSSWRFRTTLIEIESASARACRRIDATGSGWTVDGRPRPDLAGCVDIDIMGSPITNTLPVRRLTWPAGEMRELKMAYITLPDLEVAPVLQRYTRLDGADCSPDRSKRFAYLAVASGFSAELLVDGDGFVLDYPPHWRLIYKNLRQTFTRLQQPPGAAPR